MWNDECHWKDNQQNRNLPDTIYNWYMPLIISEWLNWLVNRALGIKWYITQLYFLILRNKSLCMTEHLYGLLNEFRVSAVYSQYPPSNITNEKL